MGPVASTLTVDIVFVDFQSWTRIMAVQHRPILAGETRNIRDGLHEDVVTSGVVNHGIPRIGDLWGGVFRVRVIDIKPGTIGHKHVGHTNGVRIHHRGLVVSAQIKATSIAQWGLLRIVPTHPVLTKSTRGGIRHHRVRGSNDRA